MSVVLKRNVIYATSEEKLEKIAFRVLQYDTINAIFSINLPELHTTLFTTKTSKV